VHVRKTFYWLAPDAHLAPALITVCVIPSDHPSPFSATPKTRHRGYRHRPLFVFAISSLSVYGITLAGWSSTRSSLHRRRAFPRPR